MKRLFPICIFALIGIPAHASHALVTLCCGPAGSISKFQSGQILKSISTPPGTVGMVATPDGSKIIVATSSSSQNGIPGTKDEVDILQASTGTVIKRISLSNPIGEFVLNPAGTHLYATGLSPAQGNEQLLSVNLITGQTSAGRMPGTGPEQLLPLGISADGNTVFVPINQSLVKFNAATLHTTGSIPLTGGSSSHPIATPDGLSLLVVTGGTLDIINLALNAVIAAVPFSTTAAVFGSALTPDGKTLYINGSDVIVVDVSSATVKATIPTHHQNPYAIAVSPGGKTAYAADLTASTLSVIDTATNTLTSTISTLAVPYALAFDASAHPLVLNANASNAVTIDTVTMLAKTSIGVGAGSQGAIVAPNGTAFVENTNSGNLTAIGITGNTTPISLPSLIIPTSLVYLNGFVYASSGGLVDRINSVNFNVAHTFAIPLQTPFSTVLQIATSPPRPSCMEPL